VRKNRVRAEVKDPKSHRVRSVPMIDDVMRALDGLSKRAEFTGPADLVFCSTLGEPLDDNAIRRAFRAGLKRAELQAMRVHDLRHTFGTLAVRVWPVTEVQAYMGHADIQTTMRYVHHMPRHKAASELSQLVSGPLAGGEAVQGRMGRGAPPDLTSDTAAVPSL
jgi:integrase